MTFFRRFLKRRDDLARLDALERQAHFLDRRIQQVLDGQAAAQTWERKMAKSLQDIIDQGNQTLAQIRRNTDLDQSIIEVMKNQSATLNDLRAQLSAAGTDQGKLAELGTVMDQLAQQAASQGQATADAVTANTPADKPADTTASPAAGQASTAGSGPADGGTGSNT